ncbi:hypothetical protein EYF80_010975 [Liparis tanakae]|uniref:Uncharacterized protein n=1 Tax=Liparis tanakae TaxID=230148 RepID=A0A4Z2ILS9_9TELE|nr:hypothetical protein EYF80_010975 [Liparis tanakae]
MHLDAPPPDLHQNSFSPDSGSDLRGQTQMWLPPAAGAPAEDGELHATPPPASCQQNKIKKESSS